MIYTYVKLSISHLYVTIYVIETATFIYMSTSLSVSGGKGSQIDSAN